MATGSCSFSQADNSLRCQLTGSSFMTTIITSYATVADFVDEGQFLGRTLAQSRTQQSQNGSTTTTYRYDGQRRLTEWDTTGVASESATVMGWDVNGRLTVATDTVSTPLGTTTCSFTASYNDAARTASLSLSGCTTVRLEAQTFDETFFLTRLSISYPQEGIEALFSWDVIDRFQVCK
jgi:YD repeat-containing protein